VHPLLGRHELFLKSGLKIPTDSLWLEISYFKWPTQRGMRKILTMSNSIQFFTDYLTNNCLIERFFVFCEIFSKCLVNHCLVSIACFIRSRTEIIKNVRIQVHCNSGFPFCWNNRASFGVFKIIFFFHIVSFPLVSLFWLKSNV